MIQPSNTADIVEERNTINKRIYANVKYNHEKERGANMYAAIIVFVSGFGHKKTSDCVACFLP